jgi:hypothetical protein
MFLRRPFRQAGPVIRMLQSPAPAQRLRAVHILGGRRRPRAAWLLQQVYRNDADPQIREAARQYLTQWAQGLLDQLNAAPAGPKQWTCEFCGTKAVQGGTCPNCGAPRPDEADDL